MERIRMCKKRRVLMKYAHSRDDVDNLYILNGFRIKKQCSIVDREI